MKEKFLKAVKEAKGVYYVKYLDYTDGLLRERGGLRQPLSYFTLEDLYHEAEADLIAILDFKTTKGA